MKAVKDFVPGRLIGSIVTIKVPVMQLMHKITQFNAEESGQLDAMVSTVRGRPRNAMQHGIENNMYGVAGDEKINDGIGIHKQVLHWMHGVPRPWARVHVLVMPGMKPFV